METKAKADAWRWGNDHALLGEARQDAQIATRCLASERERWDAAAEAAGLKRSDWMRQVLNAAAGARGEHDAR